MIELNKCNSLGFLGMVIVGVISNAGLSEAAALTGNLSFGPISSGGVVFTGTGDIAADPNFSGEFNPLTELDWKPDIDINGDQVVDNVGAIFQVNGTGGFSAFIGQLGVIQDLDSSLLSPTPGNPVKDFIQVFNPGIDQNLGGGDDTLSFTIDLTELTEPSYTETGSLFPTTTVAFGYRGVVNATNGMTSDYIGNISVDFAGLNRFQVRELFDKAGESDKVTRNWSSQGLATARKTAPEPASLLSLLTIGTLGISSVIKGKKIGSWVM